MTAPSYSSETDGSPVRMVSITHGNIDNVQNPTSQLSWSDFNALMQQTNAMQERIVTLEHQQQQPRGADDEEKSVLLGKGKASGGKVDSPDKGRPTLDETMRGTRHETLTESDVELMHDTYELPESAYTFLTSEDVFSIPFFAGLASAAISLWALSLALMNELDNGTFKNPLGVPPGNRKEVRMAQFLGLIIGVLLEEEIPQGLELIGKGAEQTISGSRYFSWTRIILPSLLRMGIGYTFLCCLFLTVVQESSVLDIFFDVLALQFVESIDDAVFGLSKRGFFGRSLRVAANNTHYIEGSRESRTCRRWTKRFIRFVYVCNMAVGIAALSYMNTTQERGDYRCNSVSIAFGDAIWEDAYVITPNGPEQRLLIYSHFNGVYVENGTHHGRPKYTEQNKEDGDPFTRTIGAEIVYCEDIEAWIFRHELIRTSSERDEEHENECSWLLRSPNTDSFDIIELSEENNWFVWQGLIENDYPVAIECNECDDESGCNYNGRCVDEECICSPKYFGIQCQFERPCDVIRSEKDNNTTLKILGDPNDEEGVTFVEVYGRPMYVIKNLAGKPYGLLRLGYPSDDDEYFDVEYPSNSSGTQEDLPSHKHFHPDFFSDDDFFEVNNKTDDFQELMKNYTFVLRFTGRRWYGQIIRPGLTGESFMEEEYHAFWNNAFSRLGDEDNSTLIISAPDSEGGDPIGIDFYEMRRRNVAFESGIYDYDYGPFGVLIPLVDYEGAGFFHCNKPE